MTNILYFILLDLYPVDFETILLEITNAGS